MIINKYLCKECGEELTPQDVKVSHNQGGINTVFNIEIEPCRKCDRVNREVVEVVAKLFDIGGRGQKCLKQLKEE